ncbi:sodium-independent sulfate anion transporter-like isoform X2 [Planococcus citri]
MSLLTLQFISNVPQEFLLQYLCLLTFLCGCVELLMGLLRLGFLVEVISTPVISGFTSASAVIIIISQIKHILGISFKSDSIKDEIVKLFQNCHKLKYADTALGVSCIVFLLVLRKFKDISFGNKATKKSFWFISVGRNAIIVVLCCLLSFSIESYGVKVPFKLTSDVEPGLPKFEPPPFGMVQGNSTVTFIEMVQHLRYGFAVIPIIAVLINVSIAKSFATGGTIDATQEMLTLSLCNILASFFHAMPICGAFTRSAVSNTSGVRTPFSNFYSALITIFALTFLTPSFRFIPKTTLAAVLIAAVIFLVDTQIITPLWKCCKRDLVILVSTFLICLYYGVEIGLLIGVLANLIHLIYLWARPTITSDKCKNEYGEYLVVTPDLGLFYPGVDNLYQFLVKTASRNRQKLPVAVNCCYFKGVDYTAIRGLSMIADDFVARNQKLVFYNVREDFQRAYKHSGYNNLTLCSVGENLHEYLFNEVMDFRRSITYPVIDTELQNIKLPANNTNSINAIHEAEKLIKTAESV